MLAVVGAVAAYYSAGVGFIMSFIFHGTTTSPTELAYPQIDSPCTGHVRTSDQQIWRVPDSMQNGPKDPNPVSGGGGSSGDTDGVQRSLLAPVVERITLCCAFFVLFLRWFWNYGSREKPQPPLAQLNFRPSSLLKYVLKTCHSLREPFTPATWAWSGYAQTCFGLILSDSAVRYRREVLQMTDGGIIALDWAWKNDSVDKRKRRKTQSKGIILVLPDLVAHSATVSRVCSSVCCSGYEPVVFHSRGTSGLPLTTPKIQSLGDPLDLRDAMRYLKSKLKSGERICAIGLGYGGSLLLSYLGNYGSSSRLSAAVCISPVYELQSAIEANQRVSVLNWFILQCLKLNFTNHVNTIPQFFDLDSAFSCRTLLQWLERVDCPMHNIKDIEEYWEHNEPLREADEIAVPLLCINAFDDPISGKGSIPFDLFSTLPNLLLVTTETGGHCGFFEDSFSTRSWGHAISLDFIDAVLQFTENITTEKIISGRMRVDSS